MSATNSLKQTPARCPDAAFNLMQHRLIFAALLIIFALASLFAERLPALPTDPLANSLAQETVDDAGGAKPTIVKVADSSALAGAESAPAGLSPRMLGALDYVKRRYRVSADALLPVFEVAQLIGKERRIDPLLIVAVIGIESGFNPFAESTMGAQGLMQVIPRFHRDKVPDGAGENPLFDALINITVGVHVLEEAIRRAGGLIPGLQYYAGSSEDPDETYASKVLAEKERLENAARRTPRSSA